MPRPCVGDTPMTPTERQRRRRAKVNAAIAALTPEQKFRRALVAWVEKYRSANPDLALDVIRRSLDRCSCALGADRYRAQNGMPADRVSRFLAADPEDNVFGPTLL
jgi:hypothetical protein